MSIFLTPLLKEFGSIASLEINVHVRSEERGGVSSLGKNVFGEQELYNCLVYVFE